MKARRIAPSAAVARRAGLSFLRPVPAQSPGRAAQLRSRRYRLRERTTSTTATVTPCSMSAPNANCNRRHTPRPSDQARTAPSIAPSTRGQERSAVRSPRRRHPPSPGTRARRALFTRGHAALASCDIRSRSTSRRNTDPWLPPERTARDSIRTNWRSCSAQVTT